MAYRTEVRRFTDTLTTQSAQLSRLMDLNKAAPVNSAAQLSAGSVHAGLFKEELSEQDELLARFAIEVLHAKATGKTAPDMDKLVDALRSRSKSMDGEQGAALAGIADLGEVLWALPRVWEQPGAPNPKLAKGYPEYNPDQARDQSGRFSGGGGSGSSSTHRGMGAHRAEIFDQYRQKFGYYPPRGMTNQRVEMWVRGK